MEYSIKVSKEMTNDSYISNLKKVTIFSVHFWGYCHSVKPGGRGV